jgi:toxic protein SymE
MPGKKDCKTKRKLTVYTTYNNDKQVPLIRLQGQWLQKLGFTVGSKIEVEGEDGTLLITVVERHNISYRNTVQRK